MNIRVKHVEMCQLNLNKCGNLLCELIVPALQKTMNLKMVWLFPLSSDVKKMVYISYLKAQVFNMKHNIRDSLNISPSTTVVINIAPTMVIPVMVTDVHTSATFQQ